MNDFKRQYDLEERTGRFGENVILLCKNLNKNDFARPLLNQIIRSATSVGANYMEANCACSRKDFASKIAICAKEARETSHWVRMISVAYPDKEQLLQVIGDEARQLTLIFHKIMGSLNNKYKLENTN